MKAVFLKMTLAQLFTFFVISISLIGCNSKKSNYKPEIICNEGETVNEVRLTLPNGGSKIIYQTERPILESGEKCSLTTDTPMSGLNFLNGDTAFSLVNTWYAKHDGDYNMFYIYQKNQNVIVFRELLSEAGVADFEVVYNGNIFQEKIESNKESKSMIFIPMDKNSEYNKVIIEQSTNNKVNLIQYFKNRDEFSVTGIIKNGIIDLDEPENEDIIEITDNKLIIENQWVGKVEFYLLNNDLEANSNQSQTSNSLSDIRGQVISGNIRNMKRQLREPDEVLSADDFMLKYHNWKPFSVYSSQRLLYSVIYVYENICDRPIIVIYNSNNAKVFEVMYKDDVTSFEDVAVDYGYD